MSNRTLTLKLQTFSLKYNIKQKSDENKEKFKLRDYYLMLYQILQTNFIRIVRQTENWITIIEILGVKRLNQETFSKSPVAMPLVFKGTPLMLQSS